MIFATLAIGGLSVGVWAHHMFATGVVLLPFFSALSLLIAVPTGVKFFNWIGTMWGGQLRFATPMLFAVGFLVIFLLGGLTGVLQAMAPVDFNVTDTYFVVAHLHYVVFAAAGFAGFGAIYYWFPKFTGRMMDERLGKVHFWLLFIGFNMTFLVQHQLGLEGMPRRVVTYRESDGFGGLNLISTIGSFIIARQRAVLRVEPLALAAPRTARRQRPVGRPDARVGDHLAAARAQLRLAAPDPLGAAVLRPEVRRPRRRVEEDMKVESFFYLGVTAFFVVIGAIYWFTSYEDAGTTMLAASSLLGLLAGGYLLLQSRKFPPRPEDRPDATLAEGAGPVDQFPASTIWPFVFAFGAAVFATGFVFGVWVILGGAIVLVLGVIGMIRQSRDTSPSE